MRHLPFSRYLLAGTAAMLFQAPDTATGAEPTATPQPTVMSITIQGLEFEVDRPYSAGEHVLTAGEANALNQTRAENLRNNFAGTIRKAMEAYRKANNLADDAEVPVANLDQDSLQAEFAKYATEYEFSERAGGGGTRGPTDPVEREANTIAWAKIKPALTAKGIKIDSVSKEKKAELIAAAIAKYPAITEEAKRRVEAAASIALDDLGTAPTQPQAAA